MSVAKPWKGVPDAIFAAVASYSVAGSLSGDIVLDDGSITLGGNDSFNPISPARAIRVGTAGSGALKVQYANGVVDTIPACAAGTVIFGKFSKIFHSGTSVQDITVFW